MVNDPIADMLTRIRNASGVKKAEALMPHSKMKWEILRILKENGYINSFDLVSDEYSSFKQIRVKLKYLDNGRAAISLIKKISTPGRRLYAAHDHLPVVLNNLGIAIISTSHGIMTNRTAKKEKLGGEIICEVY